METFVYLLGLFLLGLGCLVGLASLLFGLPGTFAIVVVAAIYGWATGFTTVPLSLIAWLLGLSLVGEALEFFAAAAGSSGARPSTRVAVSAIVGSIIGGIFGAPFFFGIGALFGALAGAFVGAALAVGSQGGTLAYAFTSGFAALRGRLLGFVLKTSIAVVMVILIAVNVL
jgi:hypothetical protein